ncbi:hypothetical protein [Actinosynnema sp. NPDC023587]|uniref:hypothetical protein n=1 Tax=Actinosynnema sp. NPDC023587 TaxID=3154695 RepID=UPI0033DDCA3D
MSRLGVGLVLVAAMTAAGCAKHVDSASDGGGVLSAVPTTAVHATGAPSTAATSVPPNGPCQARFDVAEPAKAPVAPPPTATTRALPGDMPPNHVDNRSWRVRKALQPDVHAATLAVAEKVRPGLGALCDAGNFAPEATRAVFTQAGQPNVWLTGMNASYGVTPPPGVAFVLTLETPQGSGCVTGSLRSGPEGGPAQVTVSVTGVTGEGTCYEPPSH